MQWSDEYATGIKRIDDQHKLLFLMTADFAAALDQGQGKRVYGGLLQSLSLYVQTHFSIEEGCMARFHCPVASLNQEAHTKFLAVLAEFQQQFTAHDFRLEDARRLVATLNDWLVNHICQIDVKLRPFVPEGAT